MISETKVRDVEWKEYEKDLGALSKKDLIAFIMKKSSRGKRELDKEIEIEKRENICVDSYISFLNSIIPSAFNLEEDKGEEEEERRKKGMKYFRENEAKKKKILILKEDIDKQKKKIQDVRKPIMECHNSKKEAQRNITPKLVKNTYKYFEKDSNEVLIKLFETFVGALRGVSKASKEDVELYLRKHKGLITSMNKLDERKVDREHAKLYADALKDLKEPIQEKEYSKFVPFYVWLDNVIRIIKHKIQEKHLEEEVQQKEDSIFKLQHEIDRNQIILDHLGIDPNEYDHLSDLVEFWERHESDVNHYLNKHEAKLNNWDREHVQHISDKDKKHKEEEKRVDVAKIDYPIMGHNEGNDKEVATGKKGKHASSIQDDSEEEDDEQASDDDEEDDDYTPDTSKAESNRA